MRRGQEEAGGAVARMQGRGTGVVNRTSTQQDENSAPCPFASASRRPDVAPLGTNDNAITCVLGVPVGC